MPPENGYVPLACHSWYSLMQGVDSIEAVCAAAARAGVKALALTDVNAVYGVLRFWETARECGLAPLLGADIVESPAAGGGARAILLAAGADGYRRLCRIITESHRGDYEKQPTAFSLRDMLLEDRGGLWVLTSDLALLEELARRTGTSRLAVALPPAAPHRAGADFARRAGLPAVAAGGTFFVEASSHPMHRLLRAIDLNTKLSRLPESACAKASAWMMPRGMVASSFPDQPEALTATSVLAADCAMAEPPWGRTIFPPYQCDEGLSREAVFTMLKQRCFAGANRRYGHVSHAVQKRLDHELEIIQRKGFADYFLVVEDIVKQSPRTCGRGSAAASIVSYCLGITHVDPVRYDLFFERFLNEGRVDPPDIDVDFAWDERDAILEYVFSKYGRGRAAMVSNHLCFRGRAAVREVAKVYGLPDDEIRAVTGRLAHTWQTAPAEEMTRSHPLFKDLKLREPWPEILAWATRLEGHPRHLSVHCGGVVIVPGAVTDHVPVEPSAKGVGIIQWEKDATEDSGLVKIDLLGNRSIAVIRDALAAVREHYGVEIPWDRFNPLDDLRTQDLIRRGDTVGVFYVESPAMRQLQHKTGTGDFEHLVIHSSIIRPAANKYIRDYVLRLRGEPYRAIHPIMEDLMAETYGIMVYQEDVAKIAIAMAGFDAAAADDLRKVLSKKHKKRKLEDYRTRFTGDALDRGFTREVIEQVWEMILSFSGYSFCKPHSASYALVSFKSAYLKAHYPAEFMAAVISNQGGYYSTFAYISECRRLGLEVLSPDVNESEIAYSGLNRRMRVGLMQVQGLPSETSEAILRERRERGPFRSLSDFLARTKADPSAARQLIKAGAFDSIAAGRSRPELMWQWVHWNAGREGRGDAPRVTGARRQKGLFDAAPGAGSGRSGPRAPEYDEGTTLRHEAETLGFLISRHPLTLVGAQVAALKHVAGADLHKHVGRSVTTVGWLVTGKVVSTKHDEPMEFVSFEDTTALYETTLFPDAYRSFCHMLSYSRPYVLRGKVEEDLGAITLSVSGLRFLDR